MPPGPIEQPRPSQDLLQALLNGTNNNNTVDVSTIVQNNIVDVRTIFPLSTRPSVSMPPATIAPATIVPATITPATITPVPRLQQVVEISSDTENEADDEHDNEVANNNLGMGPSNPIEPLALDNTELGTLEVTINRIVAEAMDKINKCNSLKRLRRNKKYTDKNIFLKLHGLRHSLKISRMVNAVKEQENINTITKDNLERVKADMDLRNNLPRGSTGNVDGIQFNLTSANYNGYIAYLKAENTMNMQKINMIELINTTKSPVMRVVREGYTECPICQDEKSNETFVYSSECIHAICKACFGNLSHQQRLNCTSCRAPWTYVRYFERKNNYMTLNRKNLIPSRRAAE